MKTFKQFLFDGARVKSVSPYDLDSSVGWTNLGGDEDAYGLDLLAQRVPWMYRGVKDRANNVSAMPWSLMQTEDELANSAEWSFEKPAGMEFLANPGALFSQIEQSLTMTGRAYLGLEVNASGYIKKVRYFNPATITEKYDNETGAFTHYERNVNGRVVKCSKADEPPVKGQIQIVCICDRDYTTEAGPGKNSPALAALNAAGVLYSYDSFVKNFFARGAIKASVLTVEQASQGEQERLQRWWDDVVAGVKNAWSAIVLRGKLNAPVVIGEGLEGIKDNDLSTQRRQDISTALGIPESRLWSAAANMATRNEDEKAYYRGTIIPECNLIAECLNEQVFNAVHHLDGIRIEFQPETLDVFQEDEAERAGALAQLTGAGVPLKLAMEILGYDLSEEQWQELEQELEKPAPVAPLPTDNQPAAPAEMPDPGETEPMGQGMNEMDNQASVRAMLKNWQRKALHALKLGNSPAVEWSTDLLSSDAVREIGADLGVCETAEQIKGVFARVEMPEHVRPVDPLILELKRATDMLERLAA